MKTPKADLGVFFCRLRIFIYTEKFNFQTFSVNLGGTLFFLLGKSCKIHSVKEMKRGSL